MERFYRGLTAVWKQERACRGSWTVRRRAATPPLVSPGGFAEKLARGGEPLLLIKFLPLQNNISWGVRYSGYPQILWERDADQIKFSFFWWWSAKNTLADYFRVVGAFATVRAGSHGCLIRGPG